jgi:hypothetical protein
MDVTEFFDGKSTGDEAAASDSSADKAQEPERTEQVRAEPEASKVAAGGTDQAKLPAQAKADDDNEPEESVPENLDGLKKALGAARGDKRRFRKQWQEVERERYRLDGEVAAMRRMLEQRPAASGTKESEKQERDPNDEYWEDPVGYINRQRVDPEAVATVQRANVSEFYARREHADYEEKKAYFLECAAKDPSLLQEVFAQPVPAEALYQKATALKERGEFERDPEAWRDAERERLRAELSGSSEPTSAAPRPPAKSPIPSRSIAGARGSGASTTREWSGPRAAETFFTGPSV